MPVGVYVCVCACLSTYLRGHLCVCAWYVFSYLEITPINQVELGRLTLRLFSLYKQN